VLQASTETGLNGTRTVESRSLACEVFETSLSSSTAETDILTKRDRNPAASSKRMLSSQIQIDGSKIFHRSPDSPANGGSDFLGSTHIPLPRRISFDLQSMPTFCSGCKMAERVLSSPWLKSLDPRRTVLKISLDDLKHGRLTMFQSFTQALVVGDCQPHKA
jgi:hypothetical protein